MIHLVEWERGGGGGGGGGGEGRKRMRRKRDGRGQKEREMERAKKTESGKRYESVLVHGLVCRVHEHKGNSGGQIGKQEEANEEHRFIGKRCENSTTLPATLYAYVYVVVRTRRVRRH